jgi:hypothetical protein
MTLLKTLCWLVLKYTSVIVLAYIAVDSWVMTKAKTQAHLIEDKMIAVRNADMQHIDGRFDRIETKIDRLLENK